MHIISKRMNVAGSRLLLTSENLMNNAIKVFALSKGSVGVQPIPLALSEGSVGVQPVSLALSEGSVGIQPVSLALSERVQ